MELTVWVLALRADRCRLGEGRDAPEGLSSIITLDKCSRATWSTTFSDKLIGLIATHAPIKEYNRMRERVAIFKFRLAITRVDRSPQTNYVIQSGAFPETRAILTAIKLWAFKGRMLPSGNPVISIHPWLCGGVCVCVYKSFPSRERPSVDCVLTSFLQKRCTRPAVRPHLRCLLACRSSYFAKSTVTGKGNSLRSARTSSFA